MVIKVLEKTKGCMPEVFKVGDWYDLATAEDVELKAPYANTLHSKRNKTQEEKYRDVVFDFKLILLGVSIEVPEGFEAHLLPRSSAFKKWGIIQTNSTGIIDCLYCGNDDEWKLPVLATRTVTIPKGTRIAQFRILPTQKATWLQKIKWLLSSEPKMVKVKYLTHPNRGGFGSTNNK